MEERVTGKPAYGKELPLQGLVGNKDNSLNSKKEQCMHLGMFYFVPGFLTSG